MYPTRLPSAEKTKSLLYRIGNYFRKLGIYIWRHPLLYIMLLPGLFFLFVYKFWPLYGTLIAFKDYQIFLGDNPMDAIGLSKWVGLKHFQKLFSGEQFLLALKNTLEINVMKILWIFPIPIVCAILLNEIRNIAYRRLCQTLIYVPYFFSWVVIYGVFYSLLGNYGIVNNIIAAFGGERIGFFTDTNIFRAVLYVSEGWKTIGYNTVIYLAAITGIDVGLYEAARVDGANKWRQIWHITIPGILPTVVMMLILKVGYILNTGFEQVIVFYNSTVYSVADIIQTYVYRLGIGQVNFSMATAASLFNAVIAFILIVSCNWVSKKLVNRSLW